MYDPICSVNGGFVSVKISGEKGVERGAGGFLSERSNILCHCEEQHWPEREGDAATS